VSKICIGTSCIGGSINDYSVHGQMTINSENGHIYDGAYDFEQHGGGFFSDGWGGARNFGTVLGDAYNGVGTAYEIEYWY